MFDKIQHIGYLTADLEEALAWFDKSFGGKSAGGGQIGASYAVASGGRNAYVRFGQVEAEIIEPQDKAGLSASGLTMHHIGYVVADILAAKAQMEAKGFKFADAEPRTNVMGQQLIYLDASTTNGVLLHLTQLPESETQAAQGAGQGLPVQQIIHAGYLVGNLDSAIAWYVEKLGGVHLGGGPSRTGGRNAFVNFGGVQVELIEPQDKSRVPGSDHAMDHVGYVVADIDSAADACRSCGCSFATEQANTNSVGQQVFYLDTASSMGSRMHLTRLPN